MHYHRRIVDDLLDELFPHLPAIALEGAKGVGKRFTAQQRAATVLALDLPAQRETVNADLDYMTQVTAPVLIDEWQLAPAVWIAREEPSTRTVRAVGSFSPGRRAYLFIPEQVGSSA